MSTPCFLLHIGPCCVAEAKGVEELEKRLHAIDYELCWLKQLSKGYKNGEDQTIEAPEGSPWAEWAKQHDSRQTSVRILGRGYSELAKEKSHEG